MPLVIAAVFTSQRTLAQPADPPSPVDDGDAGAAPNHKTFKGGALGDFSSSDYISSPTPISFAPGKTLWIVLEWTPNTHSPLGQTLLTSATQPSYGAGLYIQWDALIDGWVWGNAATFNEGGFPAHQNEAGIYSVAVVWHAEDDTWSISENGGNLMALPQRTTPLPCGPSSECTTVFGAGLVGAGTYPLSDMRWIALALTDSEADAVQAQTLTMSSATRNPWKLPHAVTDGSIGEVEIDLNFARDWDGQATSFHSKGSAPMALTVVGNPTLYPESATRHATTQADFSDSHYEETLTTTAAGWSDFSYVQRSPFARLGMKTDAEWVMAEIAPAIEWGPPMANVAIYRGDSFLAQYAPTNAFANSCPYVAAQPCQAPQTAVFSTGPGIDKPIWLWEGSTDTNDYGTQPYWRWGVPIQAVWIPGYTWAGTKIAHSTYPVVQSEPRHRLVILSDYEALNSSSDVPQLTTVPLLRQAYPYPHDGITLAGGVSMPISDVALRGDELASIAAALDGTESNALWIQGGRDDAYAGATVPAATYQERYTSIVSTVCSAKPGTHVFIMGMTPMVGPDAETNANGYGDTYADFRAAAHAVASACAPGCTCTWVDCSGSNCLDPDIDIDQVTGCLITATGWPKLTAKMESVLTEHGSCGSTSCL